MMKIRTRNPAASTDSGRVIHTDIPKLRYIAAQIAKNPPNDVASWPRLRANIGPWKAWVLARICSISGTIGATLDHCLDNLRSSTFFAFAGGVFPTDISPVDVSRFRSRAP